MRFIIRIFARIFAFALTVLLLFVGIVGGMSETILGLATKLTVICFILAIITKNWIGVGIFGAIFVTINLVVLFAISIHDGMEKVRDGLLDY